MLDEEFNKQYEAAVERGKTHRAKLLIERTNRLKFFVETFQGQPNPLIEVAAYLVLESHQGRRRAIWRYCRHAARTWLKLRWFGWEFRWRVWWYQLRGLSKQDAMNKASDAIEACFIEGDEQC